MNNYLIIIPTYNRSETLIRCLESLEISLNNYKKIFEIYVIVNDTKDYIETVFNNNKILKKYQYIKFIKGNPKYFWSKSIYFGFNQAMIESNYSGVFLMNDDTVVEPFIFKDFLSSENNKIKVCRVKSSTQLGSVDYQTFIVKPKKLNIKPVVDLHEIKYANAIACRFSFFPIDAFYLTSWKFVNYLPHYLADIYLSYLAYLSGFKIELVDESEVLSLDRIENNKFINKNLNLTRFNIKNPNNYQSIFIFWVLIFWANLKNFFKIDPKV